MTIKHTAGGTRYEQHGKDHRGEKMEVEPEVVFNMDLANAPTSERFCYEAAAVDLAPSV